MGCLAARANRDVLPARLHPAPGPDELVNAELKRYLVDKVTTAKTELIAEVRSVLRSLQKLSAQVTGFFQAPHTNYTLKPSSS